MNHQETDKGPLSVALRSENWIFDSCQIARNVIVVTVFLLIMNQTEVRLVHNQKENCDYDRIPVNLKGIRNRFICVSYGQIGFSVLDYIRVL